MADEAKLLLAFAREDELPDSALENLSPPERAHAMSGRLRARRCRQFVGGRFLLRALLEHLTGQSGASHGIDTNGSGKPRCMGGIGVSIAHSRGLVVCAATTRGEVGVDVEYCDARRDERRLAREYFTAAETRWLEARPREDFYSLWVLKEAWLKMRGTGIAGGLDRLECRIAPPVIDATHAADDDDCSLSLLTGHGALIGLATDGLPQRNPILLAWRKDNQRLVAASEWVGLASGRTGGPDRVVDTAA